MKKQLSEDKDAPNSLYLSEFQRKILQKNLEETQIESYRQRILIMLLADEGKSQKEIAQSLNCSAATVRHWTTMARMGLAHQWQEVPVGRPKRINHEYLQRLKELVNKSPQDFGYSFQRWTGSWLSRHLAKELGIEVHERHTNRLLKEMGLSLTKTQKILLKKNQATRISIGNLSGVSQSQSN